MQRLYGRVGSHVIDLVWGSGLVAGTATMVFTWAWMARYLDLGDEDFATFAAISLPMLVVLCLIGLVESGRPIATIRSWQGDGRSAANAPEVWSAAMRIPYICATRGLAGGFIGALVIGILFALTAQKPASIAVGIFFSGSVGTLAGTVLLAFGSALVLRPLVADAADHLPAEFEPAARDWRVRTKLLLTLPAVTLFAAMTVGAYADLASNGLPRLTLTIGIGLVTVAAASAIFSLMTSSLLEPLDDLIAATHRVRAGDFESPVRVVTADELGLLSQSFNEMIWEIRMREHELQASRTRIVAASMRRGDRWSGTCTMGLSSISFF